MKKVIHILSALLIVDIWLHILMPFLYYAFMILVFAFTSIFTAYLGTGLMYLIARPVIAELILGFLFAAAAWKRDLKGFAAGAFFAALLSRAYEWFVLNLTNSPNNMIYEYLTTDRNIILARAALLVIVSLLGIVVFRKDYKFLNRTNLIITGAAAILIYRIYEGAAGADPSYVNAISSERSTVAGLLLMLAAYIISLVRWSSIKGVKA
ncbi:hypothetical protein [Bacillus infantis]|uniref:hypothetical protein n=1 Tax=Bacillus infantis TaxID=324767 RepID=UPI003CF5E809